MSRYKLIIIGIVLVILLIVFMYIDYVGNNSLDPFHNMQRPYHHEVGESLVCSVYGGQYKHSPNCTDGKWTGEITCPPDACSCRSWCELP